MRGSIGTFCQALSNKPNVGQRKFSPEYRSMAPSFEMANRVEAYAVLTGEMYSPHFNNLDFVPVNETFLPLSCRYIGHILDWL